jgi:hypothetical protein
MEAPGLGLAGAFESVAALTMANTMPSAPSATTQRRYRRGRGRGLTEVAPLDVTGGGGVRPTGDGVYVCLGAGRALRRAVCSRTAAWVRAS